MADIYSVWNWDKGRYDYYQASVPKSYRTRLGYPAARGLRGVGEIAEQSVHPLPAGAQYVGEGDEAIGTVSSGRKRSRLAFVIIATAVLSYIGLKVVK